MFKISRLFGWLCCLLFRVFLVLLFLYPIVETVAVPMATVSLSNQPIRTRLGVEKADLEISMA